MSRFFPGRVTDLPQQVLKDRAIFVENRAHGAKYKISPIVHCQKQLNQFMHDQTYKKKAEEKQERWMEWMTRL